MMRSLLKCVTIVILVTLAGLTNGENDTDDSVIIENDDNDDVEEEIVALPEDKGIVKAIIQGDMNASLAALPDIMQFIEDDLPYFHNVEYRHGQDELTEMFLLNKNDEVVEFYPLAEYDKQQCNELLLKKGFYKKSTLDEEVPESYKNGPYAERDEL